MITAGARSVFVLSFAFLSSLVVGCSVDPNGNPGARCAGNGDCPSNVCHRGFCVGPRDGGPMMDSNTDSATDAHVDVDAARIPCESDTNCGANDEPCDGVERCGGDGFCMPSEPSLDGVNCFTDEDDATREICIAQVCVLTRCGDGFVDGGNDEVCDDLTDIENDGCEACQYSCTGDASCNDGNECNGDEECTDHRCADGVAPEDGTSCRDDRGTCMADECIPNPCDEDTDCNDGDECNGEETCGADSLCVDGSPMECADGDACTVDTCTRGLGCESVLTDADGDGVAPRSCTGGTDCDDRDPNVNPGRPEICGDAIDNDCNGETDTDASSEWFVDCDRDGYALAGAPSIDGCTAPTSAPGSCVDGGWTARAPSAATDQDCNDRNDLVFPGQTEYPLDPISGADAAHDFDYNCDGVETPQSTMIGSCSGILGSCAVRLGWVTAAPACGATHTWITGCSGSVLSCNQGTEIRPQGCR